MVCFQLIPMPKDEPKHRNGRRNTQIMTQEEAKSGKRSHWEELEITGKNHLSVKKQKMQAS